MCMNNEELTSLNNNELLHHFQRAVELDAKDNGNGKSPFDKDQLRNEVLKRMEHEPAPDNRR